MSEYYNGFSDTWEGQEVKLPLHEVVRLYVAEAKMQANEEVAKLRTECDETRKHWLDEYNRRENAEAECRRLNALLEALNGGE